MFRINYLEDTWDILDQLEDRACEALRAHELLYNFAAILRACYALAIEIPRLPESKAFLEKKSLRIAALFLKRALNDLRATWLLIERGYTSQAASVAASLWEHALTARSVAGNEPRAEQCCADRDGDLPWTPTALASMYAESVAKEGEQRTTQELLVYSFYHWLCRVKHPTMQSVTHD